MYKLVPDDPVWATSFSQIEDEILHPLLSYCGQILERPDVEDLDTAYSAWFNISRRLPPAVWRHRPTTTGVSPAETFALESPSGAPLTPMWVIDIVPADLNVLAAWHERMSKDRDILDTLRLAVAGPVDPLLYAYGSAVRALKIGATQDLVHALRHTLVPGLKRLSLTESGYLAYQDHCRQLVEAIHPHDEWAQRHHYHCWYTDVAT
jgi:hypothetical protein